MSGSNSEPVPVGGPDNAAANVREEEARQFIFRVKETVERCLTQGVNKAQMFRVIREEGLEPGAAFAVYKELRRQNHCFFQEYYCMIDLKEQRKRLDRLVRAYRTGCRNAEHRAGVPETMTPRIAMEETDDTVNMEWSNQQTMQARLSAGDGHPLAPATWPRQAVDLPVGEQVHSHGYPEAYPVAWQHEQALNLLARDLLHNHEQPLADGIFQGVMLPQQTFHLSEAQQLHNHEAMAGNGGFQGLVWPQQEVNLQLQAGQPPQYHQQSAANGGVLQGLTWPQQAVHMPGAQLHYHEQVVANGLPPLTSAAGLHNDTMMDPGTLSHGNQSLCHAGLLKQWWHGASANPSSSSSLSQPPENQHY